MLVASDVTPLSSITRKRPAWSASTDSARTSYRPKWKPSNPLLIRSTAASSAAVLSAVPSRNIAPRQWVPSSTSGTTSPAAGNSPPRVWGPPPPPGPPPPGGGAPGGGRGGAWERGGGRPPPPPGGGSPPTGE